MITIIKRLASLFVQPLGRIGWTAKREIDDATKEKIKAMLKDDYYIILTRRSNFLSTYMIAIVELFLTGKFAYWSHSVMNLENTVTDIKDFRLMEATGVGVHYSEFDKIFNVQSVVLLKPANMTLSEWTSTLDDAEAQIGKPYDSLFDIYDESKLSCIELTRKILMGSPNYAEDFKHFEAKIKKYKNLSPQMLYDCEDFEVVLEVKS